jgi:hypothetical protein
VQQAIEDGGRDDVVAEQLAPGNWKWHTFVPVETARQQGE